MRGQKRQTMSLIRRKSLEIGVHRDAIDALEWHLNRPHGYANRRIAYHILETFANFFGSLEGKKILCIGGGVGVEAEFFASKNAYVVSLDISATMLNISKLRKLRRRLDWELIRSDAENLPFRDGAFDYSVSYGCLHHLEDFRAGLREMCRVSNKVGIHEPLGNRLRSLLDKYTRLTVEYNGLPPNTLAKEEIVHELRYCGFRCVLFKQMFYHTNPIVERSSFLASLFFYGMKFINKFIGKFGIIFYCVSERLHSPLFCIARDSNI